MGCFGSSERHKDDEPFMTIRGDTVVRNSAMPRAVKQGAHEWALLVGDWPSKPIFPACLSSQVCRDSLREGKSFAFRITLDRYQGGYHFNLVRVEGSLPTFTAAASAVRDSDTLMSAEIVHKHSTPISTCMHHIFDDKSERGAGGGGPPQPPESSPPGTIALAPKPSGGGGGGGGGISDDDDSILGQDLPQMQYTGPFCFTVLFDGDSQQAIEAPKA